MGISDLFSLITYFIKLKYNNKRKNVIIKKFNQFSPTIFNFQSFTFFTCNLDYEEFNKLKEFFLLDIERIKNIFEKKDEKITDLLISANSNVNDKDKNFSDKNIEKFNLDNIKFFYDDNNTFIVIQLNDKKTDYYKIYGLGLKFAPFNRKGFVFDNFNTDNPYHANFVDNLYSTSNIFYIYDEKSQITNTFIIDFPGFIRYDFCKTDKNEIRIKIYAKAFQLLNFISNDFESAIKKVYEIIPSLYKPPFHSFGYTYSHWGIKSIDEIEKLVNNHLKENIPISNICLDIDYMDSFKNFTINNKYGNFEGFKNFNLSMKSKNIFLIPIIDAGIKIEKGYPPYDEYVKSGALIKKNNKENYTGTVWPGNCVFPDFFTEKAQQIFKELMKDWIEKTDTNGCWLDMNEPSVFDEKTRTISDNASFLNGEIENQKVHNMYPYNQAKVTYESFIEKGIRPMLFSRSGYTFMGQFCGNWTGDNQPRFSHLKTGFQQIISLALSAVMYTGTDIGGFWFNPSKKLLIKWFESALFHPLFRNHSSIFAKSRDLTLINKKTKNKIKNIIEVRYMLLPTIYSLFNCSIYYKKPYIMPYIYNDNGKTIINEDIVIISETIGFDPFDTNLLEKNKNYLPYKINDINLYIKKGKGIILSEKINPLKNIFETFPFTFVGNFDANNIFSLKIYFDDGISADSIDKFALYKITVKKEKENQNLISFIKIFSNLEKEKEFDIENNLKNSKIKTIN
ncbi:MAG TPA: glycoside hydrolase family 31 protein [Exilispira sp.]|nr:glycoside hydrolase family 31 protein [Exilispira sp.]